MSTFRYIIGLAVLVFFITFALKNMEPEVTLRYYFGYSYGPLPLFLALLGAAATGMVLAMFFSIFEQLRLRAIIRRQKRQMTALKNEIKEYEQVLPELVMDKNLPPSKGNG